MSPRAIPKRIEKARERWPRGMRRDTAAAYLDISTSKFDDWVARGLMPGPKRQGGVTIWDRYLLDHALEFLPDEAPETGDSWAHLNGGNTIAAR